MDILFYQTRSSDKVHNVGKAAGQWNDHAFGKLYISLTEADILPVLRKRRVNVSHTLQKSGAFNAVLHA